MSWQLGAFAILALALAGGFAWYERSRPDARVIALVGTLAAFAALGRIAFAALPNVKPTTDIVLIAGYALGGGPGFAVGALAGLASNFFFGQGPWTPWQMAGWGMVGVAGAGLAILTRRRIGRWPLALVCGAVGFGFTVLQDVGDWVTYSDHSLAALGVYVGKGIGFDCVHAAGCLVFALALGPALNRSLSRFATRLDVTWRAAAVNPLVDAVDADAVDADAVHANAVRARILLGVILVSGAWLAGQPGPVGGEFGLARAAGTPAGYLRAAQNPDGGIGPSPGSGSSQLYSGWAALGLAAAGVNPQDVIRGGHSLLDYVRAGAAAASDPGSIERTILVVRAAGVSPASFGGRNLLVALERDIRPNGSVADQVNLTAFAVLALRAAGAAPPSPTLAWLVRQQDADGGFNFATRGGSSDVDDTGAAVQALAGAGGAAPSRARTRAVAFLRREQDGDGGFPGEPGAGSNAQSTAFAVQGLFAAGVAPSTVRRRGSSPLDYLRSLTAGDGHIRYSRGADQTPTWVTAEALLALAGKPLPLAVVARLPVATVQHPASRASRSRHVKATLAPSAGRRGARTRRTRRIRRTAGRVHAVRRGSDPDLDRLASDAAILTALSLAPLGQG